MAGPSLLCGTLPLRICDEIVPCCGDLSVPFTVDDDNIRYAVDVIPKQSSQMRHEDATALARLASFSSHFAYLSCAKDSRELSS